MKSVRAKRLIDLSIAIPFFLITLPVQVAAATGVMITMGRPVLFSQSRPGLLGQPFTMRKFRTMRPVDEERGWIDDASRLTSFGQLLRSTSIDELPTLMSVIRGDMSLVGPRPLLMAYLDRYSPEQARRMEVKPGLTGLAQVNGRNAQSWSERFRLDVHYVDNWNLILDMRILLKTAWTVLAREGISEAGQATRKEFYGDHD